MYSHIVPFVDYWCSFSTVIYTLPIPVPLLLLSLKYSSANYYSPRLNSLILASHFCMPLPTYDTFTTFSQFGHDYSVLVLFAFTPACKPLTHTCFIIISNPGLQRLFHFPHWMLADVQTCYSPSFPCYPKHCHWTETQ